MEWTLRGPNLESKAASAMFARSARIRLAFNQSAIARESQHLVSKDQNTFAKRQRESDKKRKAEEKRNKRQVRKEEADRDPEPIADVADEKEAY